MADDVNENVDRREAWDALVAMRTERDALKKSLHAICAALGFPPSKPVEHVVDRVGEVVLENLKAQQQRNDYMERWAKLCELLSVSRAAKPETALGDVAELQHELAARDEKLAKAEAEIDRLRGIPAGENHDECWLMPLHDRLPFSSACGSSLVEQAAEKMEAAEKEIRTLRTGLIDGGTGITGGLVDHHGELECILTVGDAHGSAFISQEFWEALGEHAGWTEGKPIADQQRQLAAGSEAVVQAVDEIKRLRARLAEAETLLNRAHGATTDGQLMDDVQDFLEQHEKEREIRGCET